MCRVLMCAAAALFIGNQAVAQEKVSFPSNDGDLKGGTPTTITGYLYKPAGSGPFAAVVGIHGCDGLVNEKEEIRPLYGTWGEILSRAGYIVLLVDGFQPRLYGSLCAIQPVSTRSLLPRRETLRDAFGGMNYLRSRSDVRPSSIAILGQSYGATAMMFTMANGALPKGVPLEKDFRASVALYPNCTPILDRDTHWRPRQPMLLLMGELDGGLAPCKEVVAHANEEGGHPIDVHFYPETYHAFDQPNLPITVQTNIKLPPDGHSPGMGSNPEARADAINLVTQFLAKQLP
jgi:dienelactone hydrolase